MLIIAKLFLCFMIFSFMGWLLEILYGYYELNKFVNRGFLFGPICPIYGVGCVAISLVLSRFNNDPILIFTLSILMCSILEYLISYLLEKIFNMRWWDYSNMKFNINGRICLETIVPFGLLGLIVIYFLYPNVMNLIDRVPTTLLYIVSGGLFVILIIDIIASCSIIKKFKESRFRVSKDSTEDIAAFMKAHKKKKGNKKR